MAVEGLDWNRRGKGIADVDVVVGIRVEIGREAGAFFSDLSF